MLNPTTPYAVTIVARVGQEPGFTGSIHDDRAARNFGFQAALVPGPVLYGYMSRLPAEAWGAAWLTRGTMTMRNRRPVHEGETITVVGAPLTEDGASIGGAVKVLNAAGEEAATGTAALPREPVSPPDLAAFPILPVPDDPRAIAPGGLKPGDRFASEPFHVTPEAHRESLVAVDEHLPLFVDGAVDPGTLLRRAIRDRLATFRYPTPTVFVSAETQHFSMARIGDTIATSSVVVETFERNGHHHVVADQLIVANGARAIARMRASAIYALRPAGKAP